MSEPGIRITASPHVRSAESTVRIMWSVVFSLVPVIVASTWFFGPSALVVLLASVAGCLVAERLFGPARSSLADGSAVITGLLLGLSLPPGFPMWMAFLGGAFGIAFGKLIFGGLGHNIFNPALLGRAFLQAAFPVAITTWPARPESWSTLQGDNLALPFTSPVVDGLTGATPLGSLKFADEPVVTPLLDLMLGTTSGSLGETSGLFYAIGVSRFPPLFMLFSGGLMLGALYMATDMVTSPVTNKGCWLFGIGIGVLVVVIRVWGGLPEGVMYAILLMNALVPFINRATQPRKFGSSRRGPGFGKRGES